MGYIKRERYIRVIGIFSTLAFILLFIYTFTPIYFKTDTAEGVSTNPPEPTITITSGHNTASLDLIVNDANGTFATSSLNNSAQFSVSTTNASGYTLTITGDGTGRLSNSTTGGFFNTITSAIDEDTFSGDDATLYNGMWGILPSRYNSETNTYYRPAPTTSSPSTLDEGPSGTTNYTLGIGARTDYLLASGTYNNTFTLTATAKSAPYIINYLDNSSGTATPLLPADTGDSLTSEIELNSTTPTRTGYAFNGWCDVVTIADATGSTTCPSGATTYQPGDDVDFIDFTTSTNILDLYAIWALKTHDVTVNFSDEAITDITFAATGYPTRTVSTSGGTVNLAEIATYTVTMNLAGSRYEFSNWSINDPDYGTLGATDENPTTFTPNAQSDNAVITGVAVSTLPPETIQEITYSTCSTTPKQVYDSRDEEVYWIQRLADGKCWMLDNLRLGSTVDTIELTPADTNIESDWTLPVSVNKGASSTDTTHPNINAEFKNEVPNINLGYTNSNKTGVYYNTCAYSAGTYCYAYNAGVGDVEHDICPAGWRLPTAGAGTGEFYRLRQLYSDDAEFTRAFSSVSTGYYSFGAGSRTNPTNSSYAVSSTSSDAYSMYGLYVHNMLPADRDFGVTFGTFGRYHGTPIRCVLSSTNINEVTTMQELGKLSNANKASVLNSMTVDTQYPIKDGRDGQEYTIAKLGDGKVWMTENLKLGYSNATTQYSVSITLRPNDTNVNTNIVSTTYYDLVNYGHENGYCYGTSSSGNGYTQPCIHSGVDSNGNPTVWYNYAAATAKTVTGLTNANDAQYDICSVGWRLPDMNEQYYIKQNYGYGGTFKAYFSGQYVNGTLENTMGYWWSSTRMDDKQQYILYISPGAGMLLSFNERYYGNTIRCLLNP